MIQVDKKSEIVKGTILLSSDGNLIIVRGFVDGLIVYKIYTFQIKWWRYEIADKADFFDSVLGKTFEKLA